MSCKYNVGAKSLTKAELEFELENNPNILHDVTQEERSKMHNANAANRISIGTIRSITKRLSEKFGIDVEYINDPYKSWAGRYKSGVVQINEAHILANPDAAWHEFAHPFIDTIEQTNPDLFNKLRAEVDKHNTIPRIDNDPEYSEDGKLNIHGYKEYMADIIGNLAMEVGLDNTPQERKNLFNRIMTWFANMLKSVMGKELTYTVGELNPNMTLRDIAVLIGDREDNKRVRLLKTDEEQFRKLEVVDTAAYSGDNYSDEQRLFLSKIVETNAMVGEPADVKVEELPKKLQKIFAGEDTVMRYTKPEGGFWYGRVSDANKSRMKNMSSSERVNQENDIKSRLSREVGTQFHLIEEMLLETLQSDFPFEGKYMIINQEEYVNRMLKEFKKTEVYTTWLNKIYNNETYISHKHKQSKRGGGMDGKAMLMRMFAESESPKSLGLEMESGLSDNDAELLHDGTLVLDRLLRRVLRVHHEVNMKQREIDPTKRPLLLLENILVNQKEELVGSPDILVVFSNGDFGIYDHKFINLEMVKKTIDNPTPTQKQEIIRKRISQGLVAEYSPEYKQRNPKANDNWYFDVSNDEANRRKLSLKSASFDKQITTYGKIARDQYGLKNLVMGRVLPTMITLTKENTTDSRGRNFRQYTDESKVQFIMTDEDNYEMLKPIPIRRETTGDQQLDLYIQNLVEQLERMEKDLSRKNLWGDVEATEPYYKLKNNIQSLQLGSNYQFIADHLATMNVKIAKGVAAGKDSPNYLGLKDINELLAEVKLYSNIMTYVGNPLKKLIEDETASLAARNKANRIRNEIANKLAELVSNEETIRGLAVERLKDYVEDEGIMSKELFSTYDMQEDLSAAATLVQHLRSINHPLVQTFAKIMERVDFEKNKRKRLLMTKLQGTVTRLGKWGKERGLKGNDVYNDIIEYNEFNDDIEILKPYDNQMYVTMAERRMSESDENKKWFADNFHRSTEKDATGKSEEDRFQEQKARKEEYYKRECTTDGKLDQKAYDYFMNKWLDNNDIYHNNGINKAWFNQYLKFSYSPKNPEQWYSEKYKNLLKPENKPLYDFYKLFTDEILSIQSNVDFKFSRFLIPNVRKDMVETLEHSGVRAMLTKSQWAQMGSAVKYAWEGDETDIIGVGKNPNAKSIPVLYTDRISSEDKSRDLARSLMLFADFAYEYQGLKKAEHAVLSVKHLAVNTPFIKKTHDGFLKKESSNTLERFSPDNSHLAKTFNMLINYYLYGENLQDDPLSDKLGTKGTAILRNTLRITGTAAMSFHALSAVAGGINAHAQMVAMADKGKYIKDKKTLYKASAMVMSPSDKNKALGLMFEELEVAHENKTHVNAAAVSNSKLRQAFKRDWRYHLHHKVDNGIEHTMFNAVMLSFGIDPESGKIRPLDKLKELYPDTEFKSLYDSYEKIDLEDGEFEYKIINQHTGEAVEDRTLMDLRTKTIELNGRIKGQMSDRDIAGYSTSLIGRMVMQYRSWIPATMMERVRGEQYNMTMEEFEIGRWNAAWKYLTMNKRRVAFDFVALALPFVGSRMNLSLADNPKMKELYQDFIGRNPESANPDSEAYVSYDDYVKEYDGNLRALASELRIFYGLMGLMLGAMFAFGDDEEDNIFIASALSIIDRTVLELGFYLPFDPTTQGFQESYKLISKSPIPATSTINTILNWASNTAQETWDVLSGTAWDRTTTPKFNKEGMGIEFKDRADDTPIGKYTADLIGFRNIANMTGMFDTSKDTETLRNRLLDVIKQ